ncbi:hypothetical protein EG68_00700 [Paragonimus skrjabini miyazakii]|uniref:Uncharacterized protein n=1 Tax=Paragonimus skrjabini miyazakii TaxID=59628 RepID=A0A8S9Z5N7_9TREM|nr:hypothetical protein EG68_00700 [Paragonimus skrjabini miyazakii]
MGDRSVDYRDRCPAYYEYYQKVLNQKMTMGDAESRDESDVVPIEDADENLDYTKEAIGVFKARLASYIDTVNKSMGSALKDSEKFSYKEKIFKTPR